MNILILGSGGREHAFAWKIAKSNRISSLYVAPGNGGTYDIAKNLSLDISDFKQVATAIKAYKIDILIIGPEDPLVNGIVDFLNADKTISDLKIIGPDSFGARLEGSKEYAKKFMEKYNIPTAAYKSFSTENIEQGFDFIDVLSPPYVLKADGLAAGKGVLILDDKDEAKKSLEEMLGGKFGNASKTVVIEEFLDGIEYSVFVLCDGKNYTILPEAKDYKRIGEGNTGLNTGGMGAVSPVPFFSEELKQKTETQIIIPTINGLIAEKIRYKGFIFFGLIMVKKNPYVIEYNVRMGDPETEAVIPRIKNDLIDLFEATTEGTLDKICLEIDERSVSTVMAVSGGYPEQFEKDKAITVSDEISDSIVFHAGTRKDNENLLSSGGRVIAVSSFGEDIHEALSITYKNLKKIKFEKMYYRKDLGFDLK